MGRGLPMRPIDIPLAGGMNEKPDERLRTAPYLDLIENGVYRKAGAISKRNGYAALASTGLSGAVHSLFKNSGALAQVSQTAGLLKLSETNGRWSAPSSISDSEVHPIVPAEVSVTNLHAAAGVIDEADIAYANGVLCHVWIDSGTLYAILRESGSGAVIDGPTELSRGFGSWAACRAAGYNNTIVVVGNDGGGGYYSFVLDTTSLPLTWSSSTNILSSKNDVFDFTFGSAGGAAFLLAVGNAASTNTEVYTYNESMTQTATVTAVGRDADHAIAIWQHPTTDRVYIAGAGAITLNAVGRIYSADLTTAVQGATTFATRIGGQVVRMAFVEHETSSDAGRLFWEESADLSDNHVVQSRGFDESSGMLTDQTKTYQVGIAAKPYRTSSRTFIPLFFNPTTETTQVHGVLGMLYAGGTDGYRLGAAARFLVDRAVNSELDVPLSHTVNPSTNNYLWGGFAYGGSLDTEIVVSVGVDHAPAPMRSAEFDGVTYLAGGQLWSYDGQSAYESTPHWYAEGVVASRAAGGTSMPAGSLNWLVVWEWEDARGVLHRGPPSASFNLTTVAGDTVTVAFEDLSLRARDGEQLLNVRAALYRTTIGGSLYFLVARQVPTASSTGGMVIMLDGSADADLGESLYTDGGILGAQATGPVLDLVFSKDRLFLLDAEDRSKIRYSKYLQRTLAPEFNSNLTLRIPRGEGVALAAMDQAVVVFTETEAYAFFGEGPTDSGVQDTFSRAQLISTRRGCVDRNSVVTGEFGTVFRSAQGIYLLTKQLQVQYVGQAVEDSLGTNTVLRATIVDDDSEVRFLLDNGTVLVWNYFFGVWTKWTQHTSAADTEVYETKYCYATSTPAVFQDDGGYLDPSSAYIPLKIRTGWVHAAGHQGFQRAKMWSILGEDHESFQLLVRLGTNYEDTLTLADKDGDGRTFPGNFTPVTPYQKQVRCRRQKGQSHRIEIEDADPSNGGEYVYPGGWDGQGYTLSMLTLELGVKRGSHKIVATNRR